MVCVVLTVISLGTRIALAYVLSAFCGETGCLGGDSNRLGARGCGGTDSNEAFRQKTGAFA